MLLDSLAKNLRKPEGLFGKFVGLLLKLNIRIYHEIEYFLKLKNGQTVLEIGFGPGYGVKYINSKYDLKYDGVDFSQAMVEKASKVNRIKIKEGSLRLILDDFLSAKLDHNKYDRIFLINVIYFWPEIIESIKKIQTLLKDNGIVVIFMEGPERLSRSSVSNNSIFYKYSLDDVKNSLEFAEMKNIVIYPSTLANDCYFINAIK